MQKALATIKWITGCDCKHDIREIEEVIARHKKKSSTTGFFNFLAAPKP